MGTETGRSAAMGRPLEDEAIGNGGARYDSISESDSRSLGQLFADLSTDLSDLMHKELLLAQAETVEKVQHMAKGAGMAAGGGMVAYAGTILLLVALAFFLAQWMEFWIAAGIVAVLTLVIGLILLQVGRGRIQKTSLKPAMTIDTMKDNVEWAKEQVQ